MPLYDYRCLECGRMEEHYYKMDGFPHQIKCQCGKHMIKVCSAGGFQRDRERSGGILDPHPPWLKDSVHALQDPEWVQNKLEAPIESRSDLKKYLKERNLSFADESDPPAKQEGTRITPERRQQGIERVKKAGFEDRAISLGRTKGTPA